MRRWLFVAHKIVGGEQPALHMQKSRKLGELSPHGSMLLEVEEDAEVCDVSDEWNV